MTHNRPDHITAAEYRRMKRKRAEPHGGVTGAPVPAPAAAAEKTVRLVQVIDGHTFAAVGTLEGAHRMLDHAWAQPDVVTITITRTRP